MGRMMGQPNTVDAALASIRLDTSHDAADAMHVVGTHLYDPTRRDDHWTMASTELLQCLVLHCAYLFRQEHHRHVHVSDLMGFLQSNEGNAPDKLRDMFSYKHKITRCHPTVERYANLVWHTPLDDFNATVSVAIDRLRPHCLDEWIAHHQASTEAVGYAEACMREARRNYLEAAEHEERALNAMTRDNVTTVGVMAVSAAALWLKAGCPQDAKRIADAELQTIELPKHSIDGLLAVALTAESELAGMESSPRHIPEQDVEHIGGSNDTPCYHITEDELRSLFGDAWVCKVNDDGQGRSMTCKARRRNGVLVVNVHVDGDTYSILVGTDRPLDEYPFDDLAVQRGWTTKEKVQSLIPADDNDPGISPLMPLPDAIRLLNDNADDLDGLFSLDGGQMRDDLRAIAREFHEASGFLDQPE